MRPMERIAVFGGIVLAITLALGAGSSGSLAIAGSSSQADNVKIGTVDLYIVIEKIMAAPQHESKRKEAAAVWQQRASGIERELQQLEDTFKVLPPNDPQVPDLQKQAQTKQAEYQRLAQDRQQDMEKVNSTQLIDAYVKVRDAVNAVAERQGYTHVLSNRSTDRKIETVTVTTTVQEMLARPLLRGIAADDITLAVMAELKLDPAPTPATEPKK